MSGFKTEMIIKCPICGVKVMTYRGGSMVLESACKNCKKLIVFNPEYYDTEVRDIPPQSSSGGRLY